MALVAYLATHFEVEVYVAWAIMLGLLTWAAWTFSALRRRGAHPELNVPDPLPPLDGADSPDRRP